MIAAIPGERASHSVNGAYHEAERFDVVVIGGGQAGLAAGYHLARHGLRFVILDAHGRVGDTWRNRWDSLVLFTPARFSSLPGMRIPGPPHAYPTKDQVADYLETYASTMHLPMRMGVWARRVHHATGHGAWTVETSGPTFEADAVVLATGGYQAPTVPDWAAALDPEIVQFHSVDYRNRSQFQPGPVLVVGASNSGADVAFEAVREHPTVLAGRDTGQMPFRSGGRIDRVLTPFMWFAVTRLLSVDTPMGRKAMRSFRTHGFPLERPGRGDLASAGVERVTKRVTGVEDGRPMLEDGRVLDVRNVVWCTGFHGDYGWIEGLTFGDDGYPEQDHGVVTGATGLYFAGLKFQRAAASSLIGGVGRDAEIVAAHIASRVRQLL
jgi:putative flavoprotein involved in K+ transport